MKDEWGNELIPLTAEQWQHNPQPRKMYVWSEASTEITVDFVCTVLTAQEKNAVLKSFSFIKLGAVIGFLYNWDYCAEIPHEPHENLSDAGIKRMTNLQLAEWTAKGKGFFLEDGVLYDHFCCNADCMEKAVDARIKIRRWGSPEWIEPSFAVYEKDCKNA